MKIKTIIKSGSFLCFILLITLLSVDARAQLYNEVPAIEKIFDLRYKPNYPAGTNQTYSDFSGLDQKTLEREFRSTLEASGFKYNRDKSYTRDKFRRARFDRDDLVIDITLIDSNEQGTKIVIREYLASEEIAGVEDLGIFPQDFSSESFADVNKLFADLNKFTSREVPKFKLPKYGVSTPDIKTARTQGRTGPIDIPPPPEAQVLSKEFSSGLLGSDAVGIAYHSKLTVKQAEEFYQKFFKGQGFVPRKDLSFDIISYRRLRFERSDMAVEIYLASRTDKSSEVTVIKYADRGGMTKPELNPFATMVLPKEDNAGSFDLDDIPRPDKSVRYSGDIKGSSANITYLVPMGVNEAYNYYFKEMPPLGWVLRGEMNTSNVFDSYAKSHGGQSLVPSVFVGSKLDLSAIIKNSYVLEFESNYAKANITIYSNFVHPESGAIVNIYYQKKQRKE